MSALKFQRRLERQRIENLHSLLIVTEFRMGLLEGRRNSCPTSRRVRRTFPLRLRIRTQPYALVFADFYRRSSPLRRGNPAGGLTGRDEARGHSGSKNHSGDDGRTFTPGADCFASTSYRVLGRLLARKVHRVSLRQTICRRARLRPWWTATDRVTR